MKVYRFKPAYIGNYRVEAFDNGVPTVDCIVADYALHGFFLALQQFGYCESKKSRY